MYMLHGETLVMRVHKKSTSTLLIQRRRTRERRRTPKTNVWATSGDGVKNVTVHTETEDTQARTNTRPGTYEHPGSKVAKS